MCKTIELRDQIALEAMRVAITASDAFYDADHVAKTSYALADAMMAARTPTVAVNLSGDLVKVMGPAYDGIGLTAVEYAQGWRNVSSPVCPVGLSGRVSVKLKNGAVARGAYAGIVDWSNVDSYLAEREA